MEKPTIRLIELAGCSIDRQLQMEEALLRASGENYCLLNSGAPPAIVMGISGKSEELLNCRAVVRDNIPVIRRFSGGGTVIIDSDTLFVSFILAEDSLGVASLPDSVHCWMGGFYRGVFRDFEAFSLLEHDYTFGDRKFGGNAQYMRRGRWLHHTSFLWDYREESMGYLTLPKRTPSYRRGRAHGDFLCKLKGILSTKNCLFEGVKGELSNYFSLEPASLEEVAEVMGRPHRMATKFVDLGEG